MSCSHLKLDWGWCTREEQRVQAHLGGDLCKARIQNTGRSGRRTHAVEELGVSVPQSDDAVGVGDGLHPAVRGSAAKKGESARACCRARCAVAEGETERGRNKTMVATS